MTTLQIVATIDLCSGLLLFALALPLMFRRVSPNRIYGIRTRAAFASEADWYRINARGGRAFAIAGLLIALAATPGYFLPEKAMVPYLIGSSVLTLLLVLIPAVRLSHIRPLGTEDSPHP